MPDRWHDDVNNDIRVRIEADGTARWSGVCGTTAASVVADARRTIERLRARADALEVWLRAWSEQEER